METSETTPSVDKVHLELLTLSHNHSDKCPKMCKIHYSFNFGLNVGNISEFTQTFQPFNIAEF